MDGLLVMESYADDALAQPYNSNLVDLEYALERLHPRRKKVISLFLKGNKFREIGEKLGVTSERAHQIYKVAIEEAKIILERKRR
jgi:DNA-directed RNA polymerase sigma subunit (sigma70/sigma32)